MLRSLLNDWNYFQNNYCNLPFLAIFHSHSPLWHFLYHPDIKKQKLCYERECEIKKLLWTKKLIEEKINNFHFEGLYKISCYKTKSTFSQYLFSHWSLYQFFSSFLLKAFVNFEILIRFHGQAFILHRNGENLKILKEIFCQKLLASIVIFVFSDIWNQKYFSSANHGGCHRAPHFIKISGSTCRMFIEIKFKKDWILTN